MGIAETEEIVTTVKAILKTLECPICLDILKVPVSAGCGHFFCRQCVAGVLQSTYRAPCPLCKRSFTRRSVQEGVQRHKIISAAKLLANTCRNLTGVTILGQDTFVDEIEKSDEISAPLKKFKSSNHENRDIPSRKRKSFENEEVNGKSDANEDITDLTTEECDEGNENLPVEEYSSLSKRACPDSDDDSGDLPKLEDLFSNLKKNSDEKSLSIQPTDKKSELKTYSSSHRKIFKSKSLAPDSNVTCTTNTNLSKLKGSCSDVITHVSNEKTDESEPKLFSSLEKTASDVQAKNKINVLRNETNVVLSDRMQVEDSKTKNLKVNEATNIIENSRSSLEKTASSVQSKNKINALKNKTNEVSSDQMQDEDLKGKISKDSKVTKIIETGDKSKENALSENTLNRRLSKFKRKSQSKFQNSENTKLPNAANLKDSIASTKKASTIVAKDSSKKDCYTLNQVTLLHSQNTNENEEHTKKPPDDPYKYIGLSDTAVCVDSVASPEATKNLLVSKSPGWSRVKKVKKDFKMKKFSSLPVEKNSPQISLKNTTVSDQEMSVVKSDPSVDDSIKVRNESNIDDELEIAENVEVGTCDLPDGENIVASKIENPLANKGLAFNKVSNDSNDCEEMDCSVDNESESQVNEQGSNIANTGMKGISELRIIPSVSITSNSLICAKYSNDKIRKQNVLKTQKIVCELQKSTSFNADLSNRDESISNCVMQEDDLNIEKNNALFTSTSDLKQGPFSLPARISEYQTFHAQSLENNDNFQYVEQSQQTSQVFNWGLQNHAFENLRAIVPHQPPVFCPGMEKTKVLKRTCLTLEEIQDCFAKSSQTGCSETLCSVPFLSGLFKLHIGVSDETLNVSVLKVIEPNPEGGNIIPNAVSVLSDKCIQSTNSLCFPTEVVPSSDANSESSQPEASVDPYPYLNKKITDSNSSHSVPSLPNMAEEPVNESILNVRSLTTSHVADLPSTETNAGSISASEAFVDPYPHFNEMVVDSNGASHSTSSFQNKTEVHVNESTVKENFVAVVSHKTDLPSAKSSVFVNTLESKHDEEESLIAEDDLNMSEIVHFPPKPVNGTHSPQKVSSSGHLALTENFKQPLPKTCSDLLVNSNQGNSTLKMKPQPSEGEAKNNASPTTKQADLYNLTNSSDDDEEDEHLKKLEECVRKKQTKSEKKQSRLSLKKSTSFRRIKMQNSSDDSDLEESSKKTESHVALKSVNDPKLVSPVERLSSARDSIRMEVSKISANCSHPADVPSTLNSILSEDMSEVNASEIMVEIENLSDQIKVLEEKLKLCDHDDSKLNKSLNKSTANVSDDSEDSTDLFPQSVPPTPPNDI